MRKKAQPKKKIKKLTREQKKLVHKQPENWNDVVGSDTHYEGGMVPKRRTFPE